MHFRNLSKFDEIAKEGGFSNPVPDCAALRAGILPVGAVERRVWSSLVLPCANIPEFELTLPGNAMELRRVLVGRSVCANRDG